MDNANSTPRKGGVTMPIRRSISRLRRRLLFSAANCRQELAGQSGFALTDLAVAVAIMGIVAVVGYKVVPMVLSSSQRTDFASEVLTDMQALRQLYQGTYPSGALNASVISANVIPLNNGTLSDVFGGAITITGYGTYATLSYAGVPPTACANASSTGWDGSTQNGATAISINGTNQSLPIAFDAAQTACNVTGEGASAGNVIVFTFAKNEAPEDERTAVG